MAQVTYSKQYSDAIQAIKTGHFAESLHGSSIDQSRNAFALYYAVGEYISFNSRTNTWEPVH